jgi:hypothetical protein
MIIFLLILACILGTFACLYPSLSKKRRRRYLKSIRGEKITVYAENWKLKFRLKNSKKSFYVHGVYLSLSDYKWPKIVIETVKSQEDLDDFKEQLKTVQDVLDYEDDCLRLKRKEEQKKCGNFQ